MSDNHKLQGMSILLLEDELYISTALRELFLLAGAEIVEVASTLNCAITLARETAFDAAVLDISLPDGDATDLAALLTNRDVHIVFHSGNPLTDDVKTAFPNAVFAQKPSEPDQLISALVR